MTPARNLPYSLPIYDPVWAACQDNGLVATFHLGTNAEVFFQEWEVLVPAEQSRTATSTPSLQRPAEEMQRPALGRTIGHPKRRLPRSLFGAGCISSNK